MHLDPNESEPNAFEGAGDSSIWFLELQQHCKFSRLKKRREWIAKDKKKWSEKEKYGKLRAWEVQIASNKKYGFHVIVNVIVRRNSSWSFVGIPMIKSYKK